jgi:inward rectifier potassium channel
VASIEILIGMFGIAIVTGLLFARFSRPTARILFSDVVVITPFNGVPTLMLRAGNERNNLILEASVHASMVRTEQTLEGVQFNRIYDLRLERQRTSVFALSWTIMHKIDEQSPLYDKTSQQILDGKVNLTVAISGIDDTLNDTVHARRSYQPEQFKFGYRFVDIISFQDGGPPLMDFGKFHQVVPDDVRY